MADPFDKLAWIALRAVPGVGVVLFQRLVKTFATPEKVFEAEAAALLDVKGVAPTLVQAILDFKDWAKLDRQLEDLRALGGDILTPEEPSFPPGLRRIPYPPSYLYIHGTLTPQDRLALAVVGTRKASHYGRRVCYKLCRDLSAQGITVVSGLARGIDTAAHRAAVENGGRTLAILGCGLDVVYPPENRELYRLIPPCGALISEFPLGCPPEAHHFPMRNRIISGMTLGVLVVEAASQSGSHITARLALEQGREIFAVPGPIDSPTSQGPHRWIQQGAKLVQNVDDILSELRIQPKKQQTDLFTPEPPSVLEEDAIVAQLSSTPLHLEELIKVVKKPVAEILSQLTLLELQGLIRELPGKFYTLAP